MFLRSACLLALAVAATVVGGCSRFCTQVGCDDAVTIRTTRPLPKKYTVEIEVLGDLTTVACDLGTPELWGATTGDRDLVVYCGESSVTIASELTVATVRFRDGTGAVLGEETLVPDYEDRYANGEDCGVTCVQATEEVDTVTGLET